MIFKHISGLMGIYEKFEWTNPKEGQGVGALEFKVGSTYKKKHRVKFKEEEWKL